MSSLIFNIDLTLNKNYCIAMDSIRLEIVVFGGPGDHGIAARL